MQRGPGRLALVTLIALAGIACKKSSPPAEQTPPAPVVIADAATGSATGSAVGSGAGAAAAGSGQDPWSKSAAPAPKDPIARPFLWSAEQDGKTTYFLGTMHLGVDAESRLPKLVWDKLDAAPTFAMETDLSDPSLASIGQRKSGTLHEDLGPVYWKKLEDAITPAMAKAVDHMKPLIAATLLSLQHLPKTSPMDGVLHGRALNQKKQIVFLEAASEEVAILEKHMNLRTLKMMLDTADQSAAQTKEMLDAYLAGDADKIVSITESQRGDAVAHGFTAAEYEQQMEDLLYKRNASWIAPIEKLHAGGGGFVAVGAMHLVGKRSVLDMLEKRGFKITRLAP
ncbi:MAG: TraB/GumN family protein [Deltaproteobacteria bacterium]|nr:TraB/GumN family protein [Deltaproteobacteria bacterium]